MISQKRAHGVTPALSNDYILRTAGNQAAFMVPYLNPEMNLLDIGCGPGSITIGLAKLVAPGQVTGLDHDLKHIQTARELASEQRISNVNFINGDARFLPFDN